MSSSLNKIKYSPIISGNTIIFGTVAEFNVLKTKRCFVSHADPKTSPFRIKILLAISKFSSHVVLVELIVINSRSRFFPNFNFVGMPSQMIFRDIVALKEFQMNIIIQNLKDKIQLPRLVLDFLFQKYHFQHRIG